MGLYEKNMESLKLHKMHLWSILEQNKLENSGISVYSKDARDGNPVLYIEKDGTQYRMNSAYRPLTEADKWAEQYKAQHMNTVFLMFGLGNGYLLRALLKRGISDTKFIVYEPSREILYHILEQYDITDIIWNERVLIVTDETMLNKALIHWVNAGNVELNQICEYPQYEKLFPEEKVIFLRSIRDRNTFAITIQNTGRVLGKKYVQNILAVLPRLPKGYWISNLKELAKTGMPAYIVAAGPSLDKNIQELKKAKGHGVIFAVDKAIASLRKAGIEPDFLIVEDAAKNPVYFAAEEVKKLPLVASMSANAAIVNEQKGDVYYYSSMDYSDKLMSRLGCSEVNLKIGGSVATVAFSVCVSVGFRTVVFVGQDLAYGENGTTHTGGMISGEHTQGSLRYQVEGINGTMVQTRNDWYMFLKWFEEWIAEYPEIQFLDATEGGAKIPGTQIVSLKKVVEKYADLELDCYVVMEQNKKHMAEDKVKAMQEILRQEIKDLEWIEKAMERAEAAMSKLIRACENRSILTTSYAGTLKEVSDISKKMGKLSVSLLLNSYVEAEAQKASSGLNYITDDELENKKKVYKQSKEIYQVVRQGAVELREEMRKIL